VIEVVLTHAVRTPIGRFGGALAALPAVELGAAAIRGLLATAGLEPASVEEVALGHARQAGCGPNPARQAAVKAGVPHETPAFTLNMACASGLKAVIAAADAIRLGRARIAVAGGMESMSQVPFLLPRFRDGYRLGHGEVLDAMYKDGFACPLAQMIMGETADKLAAQEGIDRAAQDEYAARSQQRCEVARKAGLFQGEIVPVALSGKKGETTKFEQDEHPRDGVTAQSLAKLAPVFDPARGTVTAGNASGITDGAAALLLMSREEAQRRGYEPLAILRETTEVGVDPTIMGIGPVPAIRKLLALSGRALGDYGRVEINEAFAGQVLACQKHLAIDEERLNPLGGSIALGHPIGCTGARIAVTLLHEMRRAGIRRGIASLCVSGGMGIAAAFERP
jgi:acetyl-CoA C-acetyltransferase